MFNTLLKRIVAFLRWCYRYGLLLSVQALLVLFLIPGSVFPINDLWRVIGYETTPYHFDYIGWEIDALATKVNQTLYGQHPFMTEADRTALVREYYADLAHLQRIEAQITEFYVDPAVNDPAAASEDLRQERDRVRAALNARKMTVEAILEGQVAAVLVDEGFGRLGQLLPPMAMHVTPLPNLLVTSPRNVIQMQTSFALTPMPIDAIETLEARLKRNHDVAALVVPLGGIALYPAMIYESSNLRWTIETFAHEWLHHYLYFFPLGLSYVANPSGFAGEARIINETTADLFGKEMARRILERYYPDLVPPPAPPKNAGVVAEPTNTFDFGAEMNQTRVTVDRLLLLGKIEAAERYMQLRQAFFYRNGYRIRKINQAYFAFYGGYQGGGAPGAGGTDPIGPAVRAVRDQSANLHSFVIAMRGITTRAQLLEIVN